MTWWESNPLSVLLWTALSGKLQSHLGSFPECQMTPKQAGVAPTIFCRRANYCSTPQHALRTNVGLATHVYVIGLDEGVRTPLFRASFYGHLGTEAHLTLRI